MSTLPNPNSPTTSPPELYDPELEIRYAVVMYGGVSLAIYINGVAQELLALVAATAPAQPDAKTPTTERLLPAPELQGAQRVYRKLSQYLWDYRRGVRPAAGEKDDDPIRVRFVVDVISGTSAGGINGIFLSKALANNESMQGLKQLWLNEGDLSRLLNDAESTRDLPGLSVAKPQASLLNSQRMYHNLLGALDSMEGKDSRSFTPQEFKASPLVHELDLFITTTDIRGLVMPIKLADAAVWEPRHRNVFHFRYEIDGATGTDWNDFVKANDPFLAFTARCTSSFPFAFEPMRLEAVPGVARHFSRNQHPYNHADIKNPDWEHFYSEYLGAQPGPPKTRDEMKAEFAQRSFGDGGYLDNKPFSHATSMLLRRHANVPVERKLIYIEPAPEHPESRVVVHSEINFLDNVIAALGDLPRAETIREDLDRITERNRAIRRVRQYLSDVERNLGTVLHGKSLDRRKFQYRFPVEVVGDWGPAYAAYHRLKVDSISSLLSDRISRAADIDPASDGCLAVRALVTAWRRGRFSERPENGRATENRFLRLYDVPYALRRLFFAMTRINELAALGRSDGAKSVRAEELLRNWAGTRNLPTPLKSKSAKAKPAAPFDLAAALADEDWLSDFRKELKTTKRKLATYLSTTRRCVEELGSKRVGADGKRSPHAERLRQLVDALKLTPVDIGTLLTLPEDLRIARAQEIVEERKGCFVAIAAFIALRFRASRTPRVTLPGDDACKTAGAVARECLQFYYDHFFVYDMIAFPMQYGTESGETSEVEVYRVSPEDANQLVVEGANGRKKLAGTVLMNFGAFLERSWRRNDILWGRLDGAERLIRTILPGDDAAEIRKELSREAHDAILAEDLSADEAETLTRAFMKRMLEQKPNTTSAEVEQTVSEFAGSPDLSAATAAVLRASLTPERIREHFISPAYKSPPLDANRAARTVTRTVNIIGHMLGRLGNEQLTLAGRWLARFARLCWWIVEAASPQSLRSIMTKHLVTVVLIAAIVLIVVGMVFIQGVAYVGWLVLAAAIVFFFFVALLKDIFAKRKYKRLLTIAVVLLGILLFVPLAIGLRDIWRWMKPPAAEVSPAKR
jgi:patatin-related protein